MINKSIIDVLLCFDEGYVECATVAAISVKRHNKNSRIFCFCNEKPFHLFKEIVGDDDCYVWLDAGGIESEHSEFFGQMKGTLHKNISLATYYKWFGVEAAARKGVSKLLYLDVDVLCVGTLHNLSCLDSQKPIGVAEDIALSRGEALGRWQEPSMVQNGFDLTQFYGNAGMMYINIDAWHRNNTFDKLKANAVGQLKNFLVSQHCYHDQDAMNLLGEDYLYELPLEYNVQSYDKAHKKWAEKAIIFHLTGRAKPWKWKHIWTAKGSYGVFVKWIETYSSLTKKDYVKYKLLKFICLFLKSVGK